MNIDGCRVAVTDADKRDIGREINRNVRTPDGYGFNSDVSEHGVTVVRPDHCCWPANIIHDGSEEVLRAFPESDGQMAPVSSAEPSSKTEQRLLIILMDARQLYHAAI